MSLKKYYVTGNTAKGFVNFLAENVMDLDEIIVLQHDSHTLKTTILKQMIHVWKHQYDIEVLLSPFGQKYVEGVIVREQSFAVVTEEAVPETMPRTRKIALEKYVDDQVDNEQFSRIHRLIDEQLNTAYNYFATGLTIHDDLEAIYIHQMDFKKADALADQLLTNILSNVDKRDRTSSVYRRLFGTNTPEGAVNIVPELLSPMYKNYYLKGRAGTGKSTLMKRIVAACKDYGLDLELYHCSFDPDSIDMVIIHDLNVSIFDSTDPHEFFPKYEEDEIIDMYEETVTPGTDETYQKEIKRITEQYKSYMKKGMTHVREAGRLLDQVESEITVHHHDAQAIAEDIIDKLNH